MENRTLIMMASYNSEKYISKQIESIINQTHKNWVLIIQDDGSKDQTKDIIHQYMNKDSRIQLLLNKGKTGAYPNFHSIINKCKGLSGYDYYMFSDHDDVWLPNKVERMIEVCRNNEKENVPVLVYADMSIIDANGNVTYESLDEMLCIGYANPVSTFFSHCVFGCNTIFNKSLIREIPSVNIHDEVSSIISHDNYLTKFAALTGRVVFLAEKLMYYRRYSENVTARYSYSFGIKKMITRLTDIDKLAKDHALTYNQSLYAIKQFDKVNLSPQERDVLKQIKKALSTGGITASSFCLKNKVSWGKQIKTVSRILILLTGKYRKYLIF